MDFYDWNGNGSSDSFDSYMDYEISSESSAGAGGSAGGPGAPRTVPSSQKNSSGLSCFGVILSFVGGFFLMVAASCVLDIDIAGMPMVVFLAYLSMCTSFVAVVLAKMGV